ncbi:hypothetical protein D8I30_08745 [Brevundimonas naejangsanensis]|uniref:PRC-barrel domain containing protein n=1 Tax=Brevundimonas naejangsanensis TaxID=588932 RepID=A0A494RPG5_9CAUL|nr:hypothetical protein D8I30_08745 [Brevundimonas naejangsanensis]
MLAAASVTVLMAACSPAPRQAETPEAAPDAASAPADTPVAPTGAMALGLTATQLENAALAAPDGTGLGDIQRVDVNGAGQITGLVVAPIGAGERWVRLPLEGLTVKTIGQDHLVVADLTLDQLKAMPAWAP